MLLWMSGCLTLRLYFRLFICNITFISTGKITSGLDSVRAIAGMTSSLCLSNQKQLSRVRGTCAQLLPGSLTLKVLLAGALSAGEENRAHSLPGSVHGLKCFLKKLKKETTQPSLHQTMLWEPCVFLLSAKWAATGVPAFRRWWRVTEESLTLTDSTAWPQPNSGLLISFWCCPRASEVKSSSAMQDTLGDAVG